MNTFYKTIPTTLLMLLLLLFLLLTMSACEEFVQVDPPSTQIVSDAVFADDATATSAILAMYSTMMQSDGFASGYQSSVALLCGLSADEFNNYAPTREDFYRNSLIPTKGEVFSLWQEMYSIIYFANTALEGLDKSNALTPELKAQLTGEAKFMRAFCHFYLVNIFGDVPLVTSSDYRVNATLSRTGTADVYDGIIQDLLEAAEGLAADYAYSNGERVRPNKWAAMAMLARTYLYREDWEKAEQYATAVISHAELFDIEDNLDDVFLMNSNEAVWQLMPVVPGYNTWEAKVFRIQNLVALSDESVSAFEPGDARREKWVTVLSEEDGRLAPDKYKVYEDGQPLTEYSMVLRLAEQYLIRAEARTKLNNTLGAEEDVNVIRNRAGLAGVAGNDQATLLTIIEQERRIELLSEWGHRWLDLKRWGKADNVLAPVKGETWQSSDVLYPLPQSEMDNDLNLTPQNPGY